MKPLKVESFHAVLICRKWDACVSFYRDVLGFAVVDEKPGFVELEITPESRIGLIRPSGKNSSEYSPTGLVLSFKVEDIEETHRVLSVRCGNATAVKKHPWGALLFELKDPEQRRLEFWRPQ
jgi:catechol 2,3-dioxygenase-like lactoylglutathione lyase family enzyme